MYEVTAGWVDTPSGRMIHVLEGFERASDAKRWVRSDPKKLQPLTEVEVRSDRDYLNPVARFVRGQRGTWVVAK